MIFDGLVKKFKCHTFQWCDSTYLAKVSGVSHEQISVAIFFILICFPVFAQDVEKVVAEVETGLEVAAEGESGEEVPAEETPPQEQYKIFRASSDKIRMMETDRDVFSASQFRSEKRTLTNIANGELQRRFYDDKFRLYKIEYWKIASSSAQSKVQRVLNYNFTNENKVRSVKEKDFEAQTETLTIFTDTRKVKSQRKNQLVDDELDSFEIFTYKYNNDDKVLQENRQLYKVKDKKEFRILSQRTTYKYSGEKLLETSFYENSILRIRTVYSETEDDHYVQTVYFDGGFTVRDFYEHGIKVSTQLSNQNSGVLK